MSAPQVVLVTGPPRAGVSGIAAGLRRRMPEFCFTEYAGAGATPAAVVFVVSAVAPLVESDCALADAAADGTDVVVAVVSKIDDHRRWREVLAAGREVADRSSARLAGAPWVGAAAAPRLGEPQLDDLVGALRHALADAAPQARNALRARQSRVRRLQDERDGLGVLRQRARAEAASAVSRDLRRARLDLAHAVRRRCAALRSDLLREAAALSRREVASFPQRVGQRCAEVLDGVDRDIAEVTGTVDAGGVPADLPSEPPPRTRRLERQLTIVLGAGFGLGVALVVTRFVAGLAPGSTAAGLVAGGVVGLATTTWVVRARALLHDRAVLQVWAAGAVAAVRAAADERIGTRMLAVEAERAAAASAARSDEEVVLGRRIAALDAELRRFTGRRRT